MQYLEYIQTDGSCYFDTGIIPNINTEVRTTITPLSQTAGLWNVFFGSQSRDDSSDSFQLRRNDRYDRWAPRVGGTANQGNNPYTVGTAYNIVLNKTALYANNDTYNLGTTSFGTNTHTMYIGAVNNPSWIPTGDSTGGNRPGRGAEAKFGEFSVYQDGTLVAELIPANNNGSLGFYDTVSQTFRANLGTGTPIAGPSTSSISVSPEKTMLVADGETIDIEVECENAWTVTQSTDGFLTLSANGGTGGMIITATAPSYSGDTNRQTTLTFADSSTLDEVYVVIRQRKASAGQPVYLGSDEVNEMYLGSDVVTEAYLGEDLVFSSGPSSPAVE